MLEIDSLKFELPEQLDRGFSIELKPRLSQLVILDCKNVQRVKPDGLRVLINFFREQDPRIQYAFTHAPAVLIKALNNTKDALPAHFQIDSFQWPMECFDCEFLDMEWVERGKDYLELRSLSEPEILKLPWQLNCPNCQGMMEPAEDMKSYLRFLKTQDGRNEAE